MSRPAAVAGGAAGIAALIGLPLVGVVFMMELGRRRDVPVTLRRAGAACIGALVGWGVNVRFDLDLIRLVVPQVSPGDLRRALVTAALVGALSGATCSVTGVFIGRARGWRAGSGVKLVAGGVVVVGSAAVIMAVASPSAAIGPGAGAVSWASTTTAGSWTLFLVAVLRAAATVGAVAAGGCGGVFVPFLAIGDLTGRVVAPLVGAPAELTAAAGAAGGIAGGYRLPWTAMAMVVTLGGPAAARATCVGTVLVAALSGVGAAAALDVLRRQRRVRAKMGG